MLTYSRQRFSCLLPLFKQKFNDILTHSSTIWIWYWFLSFERPQDCNKLPVQKNGKIRVYHLKYRAYELSIFNMANGVGQRAASWTDFLSTSILYNPPLLSSIRICQLVDNTALHKSIVVGLCLSISGNWNHILVKPFNFVWSPFVNTVFFSITIKTLTEQPYESYFVYKISYWSRSSRFI